MDPKVLSTILRFDLKSFIHKTFRTLNPGATLNNAWYLDCISQTLQEITNKGGQRIIINIPPRCLKSLSISVAWPAWLLGINPALRIIVASYAQHLSTKHSVDCRAIIQTDWYRKTFPKTKLSPYQNTKNKYMTSQFGFRMATSIGGSVTGEGADILIVDDPHNPTYINCVNIRNKAINWFEQTFMSRLNDPAKGSVIIVMQRLHCNDLTNYLLSKNNWQLLKIPALSKYDQYISFNNKQYFFAIDQTIDAQRLPPKELEKIKVQMGQASFNAQYMQEPVELNIGMLAKKELRFYENLPIFSQIYQSWDTAIKVGENCDYSVCTTWGVYQGKYYLIDLLAQKLEYNYLKDNVIKMHHKWQPKLILIEDKASGQQLIQELKLAKIYNIVPQKPKIDKITRFALVLPFFTLEQVYLPKSASWLEQVINQLTDFPHTTHDDIVDSISQFLGYMQKIQLNENLIQVRSI